MSMITETCPHCNEEAEFSDLYIGRERTCPNCGKKIKVGGEGKEEKKTIPWKRMAPGIASGIVLVIIAVYWINQLAPTVKDGSQAYYRCKNCDFVPEAIETPTDLPTTCPDCGHMELYHCMESCSECQRVAYFIEEDPPANCPYCGKLTLVPLAKGEKAPGGKTGNGE